MSYARASKALGECDRCGFTFKLNDLRYEVTDKIRNGLRVCSDCFDEDHPQLHIGVLMHLMSSLFLILELIKVRKIQQPIFLLTLSV